MKATTRNRLRLILIGVFVWAGISALLIVALRQLDRSKALPISAAQSTAPAVDPRITSTIETMIRTGLLRVDADLRRAWIAPEAWYGVDAQTKELMTRAIAIHVSPSNPMVTLYDNQNAREIASYGPFQGFAAK